MPLFTGFLELGSSQKHISAILHNILLQPGLTPSGRFLWAGSPHNLLWRRIKLQHLGRSAGSYYFPIHCTH